MPRLATAAYAAAICIGVTAMPWPIGTLPIVEPDHCSSGSTMPPDSPRKPIPRGFGEAEGGDPGVEAGRAEPLRERDRADVGRVLEDLRDAQGLRPALLGVVDH